MRHLTDRKRATGMGSAHTGTAHFWAMTVNSVALLVLIPLFIWCVAPVIGADHKTVVGHFSAPLTAIIAGLTLTVSFHHFAMGARVLIEDYVHGLARKILIIGVNCMAYGAIFVALFSIIRIAL